MLVMSFFQLGFIVTYMSDSFISGYIAAANILVSILCFELISVQRAKHMEDLLWSCNT